MLCAAMCTIPYPVGESLCWIKFDMKMTFCPTFTFVNADFVVDKPCRPQTPLLIYVLFLNVNDYFSIEWIIIFV